MVNLPTWDIWTVEAAVGLSAVLACVRAGAIGRFLGRTLWPPPKGSPRFGPEQARDEAAITIPLG
jgi:hypothetical protein